MDGEFYFAYIDESVTPEIDTASLTALVVPLDKSILVRRSFYKIIYEICERVDRSNPKSVGTPILHGKNFLRNDGKENKHIDLSSIDDDFRVHVFTQLVRLIAENELMVVRLGYNNMTEINSFSTRKDINLYDLNWHCLSGALSNLFRNGSLIPVMDGLNQQVADIVSAKIWRVNRKIEFEPFWEQSMIYSSPFNFIGNVFFAKSAYVEGLQLVDVVSYLLQKRDYIRITGKTDHFSNKIVELLEYLGTSFLVNSVIRMNCHGNANR